MTRRWQLPGALLIGLGLGWMIGVPRDAAGGTSPARHGTKSDRQPASGWDQRAIPVEARELTEAASGGRTAGDRMRAAIELANRIPVDQIERWLDNSWFDPEEGRIEMVYHEILSARFLEADPERFMRRCLRKELDRTGEYMVLWTQRDPNGAEAFVRSLRDF